MAAILPYLSSLPIRFAVLGLVYVGLIAVVALAAVFFRTPDRQQNAKEVLQLLLTWGRQPLAQRRGRRRSPPPNP
jgi:hypothetical protein